MNASLRIKDGSGFLGDTTRQHTLPPWISEEDHAQQAYSQYNGGSPKTRERYLKQKNGISENGADRNFLRAYGEWKHIKK